MGTVHKLPKRKRKAAAKQKRSGGFADLARPFLKHGIPVFPANGKIPEIKEWAKNSSTDPKQIQKWGRQFPNANIAIVTGGASEIVVVDLDCKRGVDGIANFESMCEQAGIKIPNKYSVETPSGGLRLYFHSNFAAKIRNSAGRLGPGIDARASGGYVIAAGSSIGGEKYKCTAGKLDEIARLPGGLRKAMQSAKKTKPQTGNDKGNSTEIVEGTRNTKLFRDACALREIGRNLKATLNLIRAINLQTCKPQLDDDEVVGIVSSADENATQEITMRCASDIELTPLSPLWPGILYRRKVALLAGEPGLGKSLFSCDVAARISCANNWPGGEAAVIDPAPVILISGEDDAEDTIIPRLTAAGGDLSKIHIISDVVESRDGELSALSIDAHMKKIHARMIQCGAALLVFDPVSAFMADRDSHKDTSVRALLNKIRQFAVEGNYAVLLISHFNKPGERISSAVHRVMGSLGFVAAARSVYAFVRDPQDSDKRLVLPIKNNLGPDTAGFRCRIRASTNRNLFQGRYT